MNGLPGVAAADWAESGGPAADWAAADCSAAAAEAALEAQVSEQTFEAQAWATMVESLGCATWKRYVDRHHTAIMC